MYLYQLINCFRKDGPDNDIFVESVWHILIQYIN